MTLTRRARPRQTRERHGTWALLLALAFASGAYAAPGTPDPGETWRPQAHFTPRAHWMNDPNGMVYADGQFHLFFQYHPGSSIWGPMHWGHAVSRDLVHWQDRPVALAPDALGTIFSGSVVLDQANTSGLGTRAHPPLVAIFTHHDPEIERQGGIDVEKQSLAYSVDGGTTWRKYAANPILANPGRRDFRDPKVRWMAPIGRWLMTLVSTDHVIFYTSPDLIHWTHESDFGAGLGALGGVWECPDLVTMPLAGRDEAREVLLVSVNPGAPNGGGGTQYFVGRFDGHRFIPDREASGGDVVHGWVDFGPDHYAGVTWSGVPASDGRTLYIAWMSNWSYAATVPTERWRGAMTLPRELVLAEVAGRPVLRSRPVRELERRIAGEVTLGARSFADGALATVSLPPGHGALVIELSLSFGDEHPAVIHLENGWGEALALRLDPTVARYELDRRESGVVDFHPAFAGVASAPLAAATASRRLTLVLDASSLEVFAEDGAVTLTTQVYPRAPYDRVRIEAGPRATLEGMQLKRLAPVSR